MLKIDPPEEDTINNIFVPGGTQFGKFNGLYSAARRYMEKIAQEMAAS